jgi:DNA repair protein RadC
MMNNTVPNRPIAVKATIKSMLDSDRPREKMLEKGKNALSDAELIALLIGSGSHEANAIELSSQILASVHDNLSELGKRTLQELQQFKGIGVAKAMTIAAAVELGRRRQFADLRQHTSITSSRNVYDVLLPRLLDLRHEEFWILLLNRANHIIGKHQISIGGVSKTVVDPKTVFQPAVEALASGIILCHNHPSGNIEPSQSDIDLTRQLKRAGDYLEIKVLDHLIIGMMGYFSFKDNELL